MTPMEQRGTCKNILLIIVAGIGDFMESITALKKIRDVYPGARITLLVSSKVYEYARECPYANDIYSLPVSRGRGFAMDGFASFFAYASLVRKLRKMSFDIALNFYEISSWGGSLRMALLLLFSGARSSIGRNCGGKGFFFSRKLEENRAGKFNQAYYFNRLTELLTGGAPAEKVLPWTNEEDGRSVDRLLAEMGIKPSDRILLVNPGSDRLTRRWFPEYFAETLDYFARKYSFKPVITGGSGEAQLADEIAKGTVTVVYSAVGKLSIGGLISLIKRSAILFTTNSAAMHIAGILGTPFVAVAASGDPLKDKPSGDSSKMALLWKNTGCNPCDFWKCPKDALNGCMRNITPNEVIAAAEILLKRNSSK